MTSGRLIQPAALALALGMSAAYPATAQYAAPGAVAPVIALNNWDYNDIYRAGWSVERLMDEADVISALGEDIGSVENVIISDQGRVLGIVAQVGGFWDIGDTHVFVPWNQVRVSPALDRVVVPITEENVENYAYAAEDLLTRLGATRTQVVDDDLETGPRIWKATDLIDDYAYLRDRIGYGYINDIIVSDDGTLQAIVVNAAATYGGGFRAFPFYGYGYGWNPGLNYYNLGYGETDVVDMAPFQYRQMPTRVNVQTEAPTAAVAGRMGTADVTGAVATQWTFRDIDADGNLELSDREFSRVSRDIYSRWDVNRDTRLEENEFYSGLYGVFDYDSDQRITENEFNRGWRNWGVGDVQVSYNMLDLNQDGYLDQDEFLTGFDRIGYYDRWDVNRDSVLVENEFNTSLYDVWDADADNVLARDEFADLANRGWF